MKQNTTYKQTELGLIPDDWEVNRFTDIAELIHGFQFREEHFAENGRFGVIKIGNLTYQGNISLDNLSKSDCEGINNYERLFLRRGDILMALTGGTLGKMSIFNLEENRYLQNYRVGKFEPNEKSIKNYIYYLLSSTYVQKRIEDNVNEAAQPNFGKQDFDKIKIPLPPLPEQKKIADCLSTWDCAIEKQSQLINALTQRKKALMQQLLTGKKRLPGFSGEWKEVKLGDIGEISSAGVDKNIVEGEKPIRLLNFLDVYRRDFLYSHEQNHWVTANDYKIEKCSIKKGDVFFTPSSEVPNDIAISAVAMEDFDNVVYSYHIVRFRIKEKWDLRYKAYAFKTDEFFKQAQRICDGSGQRYVISQNNFKNIKIKIPSLEEQTAIAEILATADRELQLQKEKLAQLQTQKKGLMQVLLTGKKRLIN